MKSWFIYVFGLFTNILVGEMSWPKHPLLAGSVKPVFLHFIRRNYLQKIKKIREHPGEKIIYGNLRIDIFENSKIPETSGVHFLNFGNS